jgi:hypothetical protein
MQPSLKGNIMKIDSIGKLSLGIEGADEYVRLYAEQPTTEGEAHSWLLERAYRDTNKPGGYYCHRVTILPSPFHDDEFVGIIHHRFDV